jgi:hypothetical protein
MLKLIVFGSIFIEEKLLDISSSASTAVGSISTSIVESSIGLSGVLTDANSNAPASGAIGSLK